MRELRIQRGWEPVRRLRYPVISIGNLSTGGSGKTPLTIALARLLSARGVQVDVLSRGYGRRSAVPLRVDLTGSPDDYGDEPLLIANSATPPHARPVVPVYVASRALRRPEDSLNPREFGRQVSGDAWRATHACRLRTPPPEAPTPHAPVSRSVPKGLGASAPEPPRVHILDDGFQHRQLARDIDILLLNREDWHGHLLPAGNLRESLHAAKRADVIAIPANDPGFESELRAWGWQGPIWRIRRRMEVPHIDGPVAAFCGIARPEQFFAGLEQAGLTLAFQKSFADHHRYTSQDIDALNSAVRSSAATAILTTEKDRVRMGNLDTSPPLQDCFLGERRSKMKLLCSTGWQRDFHHRPLMYPCEKIRRLQTQSKVPLSARGSPRGHGRHSPRLAGCNSPAHGAS